MQKAFQDGDPTDPGNIRSDLAKVFDLSSFLDYPFTFDEVATYFLPNHNITGNELRSLLSSGNLGDIPFQIHDGYLFTRPTQSEVIRIERKQFSAAKLASAAKFARTFTRIVPFVRTVAVTGSVAYGSAGKWDDIDLFIVTQKKRLWISVFIALILVRLSKLLGLAPPHLLLFCLSYVHDQEGFREDASRNQVNSLFARELLRAKPIAGEVEYRRLLEQNVWVARMYAKAYASKLMCLEGTSETRSDASWFPLSLVFDWGEGVIYALLSRYLKLRAYLTNLKLKSHRDYLRVFEPRITARSCVYTSNFYRWLHALWGEN